MELDDEVEVEQADVPKPPVSSARMDSSEVVEGMPERRAGMPDRRGTMDPRRLVRGHASGVQGDRGEGIQHMVKMADSGFYNAFDDDFDESDMTLPNNEIE